MSKKFNVILDIDETFVQYIEGGDWAGLPDTEKAKYKYKHGFILRPHFREFFDALAKECKTINLWTWSDIDYANGVKGLIEDTTDATITNVWADSDVDASIDMHGHNKDLNYIWYVKKKFNPCDTLLVDDLPKNTQNPSNIRNGIQIAPFHPLGDKLSKAERILQKPLHKIRTGIYTDLSKDDVLMRVVDTIKQLSMDADFCKEGDLPFPLKGSTVLLGGSKEFSSVGTMQAQPQAQQAREQLASLGKLVVRPSSREKGIAALGVRPKSPSLGFGRRRKTRRGRKSRRSTRRRI